MQKDYEVHLISRGDIEGALAALISQATYEPFPLHLYLQRVPQDTRTHMLMETMNRLGCVVIVHLHPPGLVGSLGRLQGWALSMCPFKRAAVFTTDDLTLIPHDAIHHMVARAEDERCWTSPIIRYVSNFRHSPMPHHQEMWTLVSPDDPRIQEGLKTYGQGWLRVYETGEDVRTDRLGGACFTVPSTSIPSLDLDGLHRWGLAGGEDYYLGHLLGPGLALSGIYAYHWGEYSFTKWSMADVAQRLMVTDPDLFARLS